MGDTASLDSPSGGPETAESRAATPTEPTPTILKAESTKELELSTNDAKELQAWDHHCSLCFGLGTMVACSGECKRSFHPGCLFLDEIPEEDFFCDLCTLKKNVCRICWEQADVSELTTCCISDCQKPYHDECLKKWNVDCSQKRVKCPAHVCVYCDKVGDSRKKHQIWRCIQCPRAFHSSCIPDGVMEEYPSEFTGVPRVLCEHHPELVRKFRDVNAQQLVADPSSVLSVLGEFNLPEDPDFAEMVRGLPMCIEDFRLSYRLVSQGKGETRKPAPFKLVSRNLYPPGWKPRTTKDDIEVCACRPSDGSLCDPDCCENAITKVECLPSTCPVGAVCQNQRLQKRQYAPLKLFKTEGRGWGMQAKEDIPAGTLVQEYAGEIIDVVEWKHRLSQYREDTPVYFFNLSSDLVIDASAIGSLARFINHSCDPNCHTEKWRVGGETRIGIVASEDISKGTEVTYNYQFESFGDHRHICLCGSASCSQFLGVRLKKADQTQGTKRKGGKPKKAPATRKPRSQTQEPANRQAKKPRLKKSATKAQGAGNIAGAVGAEDVKADPSAGVEPTDEVEQRGEHAVVKDEVEVSPMEQDVDNEQADVAVTDSTPDVGTQGPDPTVAADGAAMANGSAEDHGDVAVEANPPNQAVCAELGLEEPDGGQMDLSYIMN